MNQAADNLKSGGKAVSITGWVCVVLGVLAMIFPFAAGQGVAMAVGIALLLAGLGGASDGWKRREQGGTGQLVVGLLTAAAGLMFLFEPWFGLKVLTMVLIGYFILTGVMTLMGAFKIRPADGWGWHAFDGAVSLILGLLLWSQFPVSAIWLIGLLVGIRLFFMGIVMIITGKAVREVAGLVNDGV